MQTFELKNLTPISNSWHYQGFGQTLGRLKLSFRSSLRKIDGVKNPDGLVVKEVAHSNIPIDDFARISEALLRGAEVSLISGTSKFAVSIDTDLSELINTAQCSVNFDERRFRWEIVEESDYILSYFRRIFACLPEVTSTIETIQKLTGIIANNSIVPRPTDVELQTAYCAFLEVLEANIIQRSEQFYPPQRYLELLKSLSQLTEMCCVSDSAAKLLNTCSEGPLDVQLIAELGTARTCFEFLTGKRYDEICGIQLLVDLRRERDFELESAAVELMKSYWLPLTDDEQGVVDELHRFAVGNNWSGFLYAFNRQFGKTEQK